MSYVTHLKASLNGQGRRALQSERAICRGRCLIPKRLRNGQRQSLAGRRWNSGRSSLATTRPEPASVYECLAFLGSGIEMHEDISCLPEAADRRGEFRDSLRISALWHQKAAEYGRPPPVTAFDISQMARSDWGYGFLICYGSLEIDHSFLAYGSQFGRLLELPASPVCAVPFSRQPNRYLHIFTAGCAQTIAQGEPVVLSGSVAHLGHVELYRAVFMPLAALPNSPVRRILGSFNRRTVAALPAPPRRYQKSL
jgi:hypothetical protein